MNNSTTERKITMKQMCEHIVKADFLKKEDGAVPTAIEIFNYSSTGELINIFEWYKQAVTILGYEAE